ncbi:MAG: DUF4352 domain-containing protein [Candidatus Phosphoribacter sp.]|nr:DUF4352 domain-containing protein [Actinomycetales bacterium]
MNYKPGDVANGYVLGEDNQWHPLPAPPTEAMPSQPAQSFPPVPQYQPVPPYAAPAPGYPPQGQPGYQPQGQPGYQPQGFGQPAEGPGSPRRRPVYKAWWFWLLIVFVLVLAAGVIGAISLFRAADSVLTGITSSTAAPRVTGPSPVRTPAKTPSLTPAPAPTSTASASGGPIAGVTGRDGDLQFTVTGMSCDKTRVGTEPLVKEAEGVFCLVSVTVTNTSTSTADFNPFFQKGFDAAGNSYTVDLAASIFMDDTNGFLDDIPAGKSVSGVVPFDVPKGSRLATVEFHESFTSPGLRLAVP